MNYPVVFHKDKERDYWHRWITWQNKKGKRAQDCSYPQQWSTWPIIVFNLKFSGFTSSENGKAASYKKLNQKLFPSVFSTLDTAFLQFVHRA